MVLYMHSHDTPDADLCSALVGAGPARVMGVRQGYLQQLKQSGLHPSYKDKYSSGTHGFCFLKPLLEDQAQ